MTDEPAPQIMMSVDKPDALAAAEIHAIRQMADAVTTQSRQLGESMGALTRSLEKVVEKLDDVRGRVIRLEEQKHGAEIEALKLQLAAAAARLEATIGAATARIDSLESERDQVRGAKAMFAWISTNAPWLAAMLLGAGVYITEQFKKS